MSLRLVNRVTNAVARIPCVIKSHATNPKYILQHRMMSKKNDGTCKEDCGAQFFEGCFKKEVKKECPETKVKKEGTCSDSCKDGPCKQRKK